MLPVGVELQGMREAARVRHPVPVPERGAAATVDGQMLDVNPRPRRGEPGQRLGRVTAAAVVHDDTGQPERRQSVEHAADGLAVLEDRNQQTRLQSA